MRACEVIMDLPEWDGSDGVLALLVHGGWDCYPLGNTFLTDPKDPLQVGLIRRSAGSVIARHEHPPQARVVSRTMEVLYVRSGRLEVQVYNSRRQRVTEREIKAGDWWVQVHGGHGFTVIEECELVEVKQGPYDPLKDKVLF